MTIKPKDTSIIRKTKITDSKRFGIVISRSDMETLKEIAFRMHTTASEIIRQLVHEYVQKHKEKRNAGTH